MKTKAAAKAKATASLEQLTKAAVEQYQSDPSAASVVVSYLMEKEVWYVSVCRYKARYGEQKVVVCNAQDADLSVAIHQCATKFLMANELIAPKHVEELVNLIG